MKRGRLRLAFDRTVRTAGLDKDLDAALIESGRFLVDQVDEARELSTADGLKAAYLLPHLMNLLREIGATPAARKSVQHAAEAAQRAAELAASKAGEESSGGVSRIAEFQRRAARHKGGAASGQ